MRTIADPIALLRHLDVSGRFHRDSRFGRAFHRGMVSLRENVPTDSLHVVVDGNRVAAHVDGVSPLAAPSQGGAPYSLRAALTHNLAGMAQDVAWLLRGRQGDHRCELDCEWVLDEAHGTADQAGLLDPAASSWSVQLEARVAGRFDEGRLRAALDGALGRHASTRDPLEVVDCAGDDALDAARARLQGMVVAVTENPPLHVYLARHPAGDVLMLNLNHAAADGVGALAVMQRIAREYAGDGDGAAPLEFLAVADLPVRPAAAATSLLARLRKRAVERLRDTLTQPARLAAEQPADDGGYGFHQVALPAADTRLVGGVEGSSRDVLMAALHLAIGEWNRQHGTPGRRIGVLEPVDLRPAPWPQDTIGNFSVTARVSTSRRERADAVSALDAVTAQTARNMRARSGIALIAALRRSGLLALWTKQSTVVLEPLTTNRLVDAAMLCNLGCVDDAPRFGPDLGAVAELWLSTPARSPLSLSVGAITVAGRLHLTLRYPRRVLSAAAARRLSQCVVDQARLVALQRARDA
jgi:NRPS condensation-like uncharacterized protein